MTICTASRCVKIVVLTSLILIAAGCGTKSQPTADPALESARETANSFLHALRNQDGSSAYAVLSKDYRERLSEGERTSKKMYVTTIVENKPVAEWKRGGGKLSDNKEQATFEDFLQSNEGKEYQYRLVLVKEGPSWRVDLFTVRK